MNFAVTAQHLRRAVMVTAAVIALATASSALANASRPSLHGLDPWAFNAIQAARVLAETPHSEGDANRSAFISPVGYTIQQSGSSGFSWNDAGIGAAAAFALTLGLAGLAGGTVMRRRRGLTRAAV